MSHPHAQGRAKEVTPAALTDEHIDEIGRAVAEALHTSTNIDAAAVQRRLTRTGHTVVEAVDYQTGRRRALGSPSGWRHAVNAQYSGHPVIGLHEGVSPLVAEFYLQMDQCENLDLALNSGMATPQQRLIASTVRHYHRIRS